MDKIRFLTQELEDESELTKLILEKSIVIIKGIQEHTGEDSSVSEVSLILANLIEYISAIIVNNDSLEMRIEALEEQLLDQ